MRDRVDLQYRYTRRPSLPSPAFPNQKETWSPLVPLGIRHGTRAYQVFALLDTGSHWTIIGTKHADALGIDWKSAPSMSFVGLGNLSNKGYGVDVRLWLVDAKYGWDARVVVSEAGDEFPDVLLGHGGFFEHFEVRFKAGQQHFRINLK